MSSSSPISRPPQDFTPPEQRERQSAFTLPEPRERISAFTLVEMLVVIAIVLVLTLLLAPAFTSLKSAGDVTSAANTIKDVLEQARTYAMANNTYAWVGFAGSVGTTSASVTGVVSVAIIGSNDGTQLGTSSSIPIGKGVGTAAQVGKMIQLTNMHIGDTGVPTNNGTEFESRPNVASAYRMSSVGNSTRSFSVQQTTFQRWIQFSPRGEALVNGGATQIARYAEIGILPTRGSTLAATPNIVAIEISGFGGNVKIYRR